MIEYANELKDLSIRNVDPGALNTKMTVHSKPMPIWVKPIRKLFFQPASKGGKRLYDAVFLPEYKNAIGVYISGNSIRKMIHTLSTEEILTIESDIS